MLPGIGAFVLFRRSLSARVPLCLGFLFRVWVISSVIIWPPFFISSSCCACSVAHFSFHCNSCWQSGCFSLSHGAQLYFNIAVHQIHCDGHFIELSFITHYSSGHHRRQLPFVLITFLSRNRAKKSCNLLKFWLGLFIQTFTFYSFTVIVSSGLKTTCISFENSKR